MSNWQEAVSNAVHGEIKNYDRGAVLAHRIIDIVAPVINAQMAEANDLDKVIERCFVREEEATMKILTLLEAMRCGCGDDEPAPFCDDRARTVRLHEYPYFGTAREVYSPQSNKWYHEAWVE